MKQEIVNQRNTAFYINGGIGRVICAIPALEKYHRNNPPLDRVDHPTAGESSRSFAVLLQTRDAC